MRVDASATVFLDKSKALLWTSAMHDVSRLVAQVARFYEHCALFHGREAEVGDVHVDVRWLAEVMNDAASLAGALASNDFGSACLETEDLLKGFTSLVEGSPRFDAEMWGGRHSWENARCSVLAMSQRWDSAVQGYVVQTVHALKTLHGKLVSLDQVYSA